MHVVRFTVIHFGCVCLCACTSLDSLRVCLHVARFSLGVLACDVVRFISGVFAFEHVVTTVSLDSLKFGCVCLCACCYVVRFTFSLGVLAFEHVVRFTLGVLAFEHVVRFTVGVSACVHVVSTRLIHFGCVCF